MFEVYKKSKVIKKIKLRERELHIKGFKKTLKWFTEKIFINQTLHG